jgi:Ca2+-binding RTX toxin-like protein
MKFLLNQIRFRPLFDAAGVPIIAWNGIGAIYDQTGNQLWDGSSPLTATLNGVQVTGNTAAIATATFGASYNAVTDIAGLRQVSGNGNNLVNGQFTWGAVDQLFARSAPTNFTNYLQQSFGLAKRGDPVVANLSAIAAPTFAGSTTTSSSTASFVSVGPLQIDRPTFSTGQTTVTMTTTTNTRFADGHHWNASLAETTTSITTATDVVDVFGTPVTAGNKFALPGTNPSHATNTVATSDTLLTGGELDTSSLVNGTTFRGVSGNLHPGLQSEISKIMGSGTDPAVLTDYTVKQNADLSINMHDVVDYTPRMISQTITGNGSKVVYDSKGHYVSGDGVVLLHDTNNHLVYYSPGMILSSYVYDPSKSIETAKLVVGEAIVDTTVPLLAGQADGTGNPAVGTGDGNIYSGAGYGQLSIQGQHDKQNLDNHEYFYGNVASIPGNAPNNGFFALFGQFFDHGLDFIGKSSGYNIVIPLGVDDPLYGQLGPDGRPQTSITITRATVTTVDAAGNPQYIDHTSPYIDQSQTYGSVADVTQILRAWVPDPLHPGQYIAGATLFDGNHTQTYTNAFGEATKATLPTLNELRAEVMLTRGVTTDASGMDILDSNNIDQGLTWEDVSQAIRHRDATGHIVVGADGKPVLSTEPLLLDMNPKFDVGHLSSAAAIAAMGVLGLTFDVNGQISLAQLAKWVNFADFSIQTTQYGAPTGAQPAVTAEQHRAIGEILLDSVGDHYIAGDGRANENFGLTAIHQVWHEEHGYQVRNIQNTIEGLDQAQVAIGDVSHKTLHDWQVAISGTDGQPMLDALGNYVDLAGAISWNQDTLFNAAKLTVEMEYQHVAVDQYARAVSPDIQEFAGYSSGKNAAISLEFSQAAFRFGHSTLRETIDTMDPNGFITGKITSYALESAFLNPQGFANVGAGAIVQGETRQLMNEVDEYITPSLQQGLLGQPLDLGAINIARGRDVGLPTLNEFRLSAGFSAYANWNDFGIHLVHTSSLVNFIAAYAFDGDAGHAQAILDASNGLVSDATKAFGLTQASATAFLSSADPAVGGNDSFNKIDLWIGGLAEKHVAGGVLGETFNAIFVYTIENLMDGDRFYYLQRLINQDFGNEIQNEQFVDIVQRNTGTQNLNGNIFAYADQYIDFTQTATDTTTVAAVAAAYGSHQYGSLLATAKVGIYSDGGTSTAQNGTVLHENFSIITSDASFSGATTSFPAGYYASQSTTISGDYILDARPDHGTTNLDGSPDTGAGSAEVIVGTAYNDYIVAGEGDDTLYLGDGNDVAYGGGGADKLYGGNGNDYLYGGDAADLLDGGAGDDHVFGDSSGSSVNGIDQLIGGSGNDYIYGGIGIDKIFGGTGDDFLSGGQDTDPFMYGGDGNDYMDGGSGQDILFGGNGSDVLDGGTGIDQLYGDGGDDILRPGDGVSDISGNGGGGDVLIGGDNVTDTGFDLADYSQQTAATGLVGDLTNQVVSSSVLDKLIAGQKATVFSTSTIWFQLEGVIGTPSSDRLYGDSSGDANTGVSHGDNWLIGGSGNDELTGRGGNDVLIGKSIRLDTLIGTYSGTYIAAEDANGASHRVSGTLSGGLLDFASGSGITFEKNFQELLKSQAYKDYKLGDGGLSGGIDQADYSGNLADYKFGLVQFQSANEGVVTALEITDTVAGRDGTDLTVGLDNFKFLDGTFNFAQVLTPVVTGVVLLGASNEDTTFQVNASDLLKNVTDFGVAAGTPTLSVLNLTASAGTLTLNADGVSWTYTPPADYNSGVFQAHGPVTFSYTVTNGLVQVPVADMATLVITPVNDAPIGLTTVAVTATTAASPTVTVSDSLPITDADYFHTGANGTNRVPAGQLTYKWLSSSNPGAVSPVWTTLSTSSVGAGSLALSTAGSVGRYLQASASYTDPDGTAETVKSATYVFGDAGNNGGNGTITQASLALGYNDPGADIMYGLGGNDVYAVNNVGDVVVEAAASGTDTVQTTLGSYSLGANVEKLTYAGAGNFVGTGNALANVIVGRAGGDTLDGGTNATGVDRLVGGAGNDTYIVRNVGDVVAEAAGGGTDTVLTAIGSYALGGYSNVENLTYTGVGSFKAAGNSLANVITGGAGADYFIDGSNTTGVDTLIGGGGNDTYDVSNVGDVIVEAPGGGTDTVILRTTVGSYSLGANVENLTYAGAGNFAGTGNARANVIVGGAGNDTLDGGTNITGVDKLFGGAGNDIYIVRNLGDLAAGETAGGGTDTVLAVINSYTLGANVENMTFIGSGAFTGEGNGLANVISGGAGADNLTGWMGNDTLIGGGGADILRGGSGSDVFVLAKGDANNDLITDFTHSAADLINFTGYGAGASLVKSVVGTATQPTSYDVRVGGVTQDTFKLSGNVTLVATDYKFV